MNGSNRTQTLIAQGFTVLTLMFIFGTSCSDNSGLKAQLAQMQTQMVAQQQIDAAKIQSAHDQTKITCYSQATDANSKALCDKL